MLLSRLKGLERRLSAIIFLEGDLPVYSSHKNTTQYVARAAAVRNKCCRPCPRRYAGRFVGSPCRTTGIQESGLCFSSRNAASGKVIVSSVLQIFVLWIVFYKSGRSARLARRETVAASRSFSSFVRRASRIRRVFFLAGQNEGTQFHCCVRRIAIGYW